MSRLEAWQRYRKATPCPICGGYGAYKPENRCKGFLSANGDGAFCSTVSNGRKTVWFESIGTNLWFHLLWPEVGEGEVGRQRKWYRSRILALRLAGWNRTARKDLEAVRRPDWRDFG